MKNRTVRWLLPLIAIFVLLLFVAAFAGFFRDKIEPGLEEVKAMNSDSAIAVVRREEAFSEPVAASIEAREATIISSRLLARIVSIEVRAGDYVDEGQLLLRLEDTDLLARAQQARERIKAVQARLVEARQNLARVEELRERGLIALAERDAARAKALSLEAGLASAQQALEEAQTAAGYAEIRSPIAGRIVDRFAEPGDTAAPGAKLMSLYNPFSLWVEARVREQLALSLKRGQVVRVDVPAMNKFLEARIEEIVPAADTGSRSFLVKALLPSEQGLLPGMYARLQVPAGSRAPLVVPVDRVATVGQLDVVWVLQSGGIVRRFVRLGRPAGEGLIEVVAGLEEGDRVLPLP